MLSDGLDLLHTVLFGMLEYEELLLCMGDDVSWQGGGFLETNVLSVASQTLWRSQGRTDRDFLQQLRSPFHYLGERDATAPPFGWTLIWDDMYSNMYGDYIPDAVRNSGFVMWDGARVKDAGGEEILEKKRDEGWGGVDPRDGLDEEGWGK